VRQSFELVEKLVSDVINLAMGTLVEPIDNDIDFGKATDNHLEEHGIFCKAQMNAFWAVAIVKLGQLVSDM